MFSKNKLYIIYPINFYSTAKQAEITEPVVIEIDEKVELEKKIKGLKKKLRQSEDLLEKTKLDPNLVLNDDQMKKIEKTPLLQEELKETESLLAALTI